jgi:hypothetical protein
MNRQYARISALLFGAVALLQLVRVINGWSVAINGFAVQVWASWIIIVVTGALCVWGWRTSR